MYFHLYEVHGHNQLQVANNAMQHTVVRLGLKSTVHLATPRHIVDNSFFVAVGFDSLSDAEKAREVVSSIPNFVDHFFTYRSLASEDVREFLSGQLCGNDLVKIPQVDEIEDDDPFNLQTPTGLDVSISPSTSLFNFEQFHWYLSSIGHGNWTTVLRIASNLGLSERIIIRQIFRNMVLLGHVALSSDGKRWTSLPTTVLRRASKPERAFFAGQMVPTIEGDLSELAQLRKGNQSLLNGPKRYSINWDYVSENADIFAEHGWRVCDSYWKLLNSLPKIDMWKNSLSRFPSSAFSSWTAERWNPIADNWENNIPLTIENIRAAGDGFYRLRFSGPVHIERYLYGDAHTGELLSGDWYGLRWLAASLSDSEANVAWHADPNNPESGQIVVPELRRWPLLYERALVLASGKLPMRDTAAGRLIYKGISKQMAEQLVSTVGAKLQIVEGTV